MSRRWGALLAAVLLTVSACASGSTASGSGDGGDEAAGGGAYSTETGGGSGLEVIGEADLGFRAETLDGASFDGASLAGKPAVLWFWAPWCPTCRAQAPNVSRLAQDYAGQVTVVGVGGLSDAGDIRDFATRVDGPVHLVDEPGDVWRHFGVTAQSTYVVVDADGGIVAEGYLDDPVLNDTVAQLAG